MNIIMESYKKYSGFPVKFKFNQSNVRVSMCVYFSVVFGITFHSEYITNLTKMSKFTPEQNYRNCLITNHRSVYPNGPRISFGLWLKCGDVVLDVFELGIEPADKFRFLLIDGEGMLLESF